MLGILVKWNFDFWTVLDLQKNWEDTTKHSFLSTWQAVSPVTDILYSYGIFVTVHAPLLKHYQLKSIYIYMFILMYLFLIEG